MLPHEHGAWSMFAASLWIGLGVGGVFNQAIGFFVLSALGFFLWRYPMGLVIKSRTAPGAAIRWSMIYGCATAISAAVLLVSTQLWELVPLGLIGLVLLGFYLWQVSRRAEMSVAGEWIGMAGLALATPAGYLVATRALDATALALYGLNLLYFGSTIFYIKFKVREQPRLTKASVFSWTLLQTAGRASLFYQAIALILVTALALGGWVPWLVILAFVCSTGKVLWGVFTRPARLSVRRLGLIEVAFTVVYALLVWWAYR
jgi:hypothetical protein